MTPVPVPESLLEAPSSPDRSRALVLFDGDCRFCQKSVSVLKVLDWFGRLAFQNARDEAALPKLQEPLNPARLIEEMHLVTPGQDRVYAGYAAFRWMAWRLPLLWPLAPLMYLPGAAAIGNRVYRWVARHRFGLVPCENGVCQVPLKRS